MSWLPSEVDDSEQAGEYLHLWQWAHSSSSSMDIFLITYYLPSIFKPCHSFIYVLISGNGAFACRRRQNSEPQNRPIMETVGAVICLGRQTIHIIHSRGPGIFLRFYRSVNQGGVSAGSACNCSFEILIRQERSCRRSWVSHPRHLIPLLRPQYSWCRPADGFRGREHDRPTRTLMRPWRYQHPSLIPICHSSTWRTTVLKSHRVFVSISGSSVFVFLDFCLRYSSVRQERDFSNSPVNLIIIYAPNNLDSWINVL